MSEQMSRGEMIEHYRWLRRPDNWDHMTPKNRADVRRWAKRDGIKLPPLIHRAPPRPYDGPPRRRDIDHEPSDLHPYICRMRGTPFDFTFCKDCDVLDPGLFHVHDKLWNRVADSGIILCLKCFEKRLGRKVTRRDLTDAPLNANWPQLYHERTVRMLLHAKDTLIAGGYPHRPTGSETREAVVPQMGCPDREAANRIAC